MIFLVPWKRRRDAQQLFERKPQRYITDGKIEQIKSTLVDKCSSYYIHGLVTTNNLPTNVNLLINSTNK